MFRNSSPKTRADRHAYEQLKVTTRASQAPEDIDVKAQRENKRYRGAAEHALGTYDEACQQITWVDHT